MTFSVEPRCNLNENIENYIILCNVYIKFIMAIDMHFKSKCQ